MVKPFQIQEIVPDDNSASFASQLIGMQYVALPEVEANMNLRLFSVISMHGHVAMTAHWMIVPWEAGGGDVEFN